jgi:tetratricopeptide (TPR) repeat protein
MDARMRVVCGAWRRRLIVVGCLMLALQMCFAQKKPAKAAPAPNNARIILSEKAHALEARGRPDMAVQLWQQILLAEPQNAEALAGLAKDYKLIGSVDKANDALKRLRSVNPNDPNIGRISSMSSTRAQSDRLRQAGDLAGKGRSEDAMRIYRELYGDHPPDGDIALAYYQTLYGTANGKDTAIAAMRALAARNPGDTRFSVELGIMLTYGVKTRTEGIRILQGYPRDSAAQSALRQALVWDAANPSSASQLRQYLKDHPQDKELSGHLKESEAALARMNSGIARTSAERAAFASLNGHRLEEAETRFKAILQQEPDNARIQAGMGFLRMQQQNFGDAITYLTQAEKNGYKSGAVQKALSDSQFWSVMGEASQAFDENALDVAAAKYREALAMRPRSQEALNGLAGLLTKEEQYPAAAGVYEQLTKIQPGNAGAWRGLFLAYARDGQNQKAIATSNRFPASAKSALAKDPEYLRTLATIYHALGRNADAQRALAQALALPFPDNGVNLKADTRLQYAGILMEAKRFDQAATLYTQILNDDSGNLSAWMGLVSAHHELGQDTLAIADVQKMPPSTYEEALADSGFLSMLGAIYQQANQFEIAQGLLERSAKLQTAAGGQPSIALQLQLAAIYLQRNNTAQAYAIYRQVLTAHPDRADAWKGLISTLLLTNRNTEALSEIALIPPAVRKQLESDIDFVQSEASLYAATGDTRHAIEYMNRVQAHYNGLKTRPPASVEIQNAWLLFNTKNDRALYPALMRLGGRQDLTVVQRGAVQEIWANWSVRRAGTAMDNGNIRRAVDILDAAYQAFPDNLNVRKAVAGGYLKVNRAKDSLTIFKSIPLQNGTAADFQGAIGAALSANDKAQAEVWLRQALDRYPRDSAILALAARYEQARGDNQRAAEYWRASLAVMPRVSPADKLAHTLVYPDQDQKTRRAATAADLQRLLDPSEEPFPKTTKLPPLPAYGADPYNGGAPVILSQSQQTVPQNQWNSASSAETPSSYATASAPATDVVPVAQASNSQLSSQQNAAQMAAASQPVSKSSRKSKRASSQLAYSGRMHLPASKQTISSPASDYVAMAPQSSRQNSAMDTQSRLEQTLSPERTEGQLGQVVAPVELSPAADSWKGLIFSLLASHRTTEASQEIARIPTDLRKQLEADVEFQQAEASLFAATGDMQRATEYMNRVQNYYLLRRAAAPAGVEVQHAWLLYNTGNDHALYSVLQQLEARPDLTSAQREDVQTIWGNWSVRRANAYIEGGNTQRAIDILEAAIQEYPDNPNVRKAVAGGYVKVGRADEAMAIFKAYSMQEASAADFQGAISAALATKNMAQAEAWLRQALERYPSDAGVLAVAARFEQARGNNQRATDFWRASLAAMPAGTPARKMPRESAYPQVGSGYRSTTAPGDLKQLLNPGLQPAEKTGTLPAYPTTSPNFYNRTAPVPLSQLPSQQNQRIDSSISTNLPLPNDQQSDPTVPAVQESSPSRLPVYIPQSVPKQLSSNQPVFIEQSATREAVIKPATGKSQSSQPTRSTARAGKLLSPPSYTGSVQMSPTEENVDSTEPISNGVPSQQPDGMQATMLPRDSNPARGLRITSQPMDAVAANAQVLFAEQTDGQLTQGSATVVRALPNAPVRMTDSSSPSVVSSGAGQYTMTQYTPSAQEAATGAYSAPRQQTVPQPQNVVSPQVTPSIKPPATKKMKMGRKSGWSASTSKRRSTPTLASAPPVQEVPQQYQYSQQEPVPELPSAPSTATTGAGLTDEELQQRNLPPLRGPWVRVQRESRTTSPRDEAEMQLRSIESGYSGWLGGAGVINYRTGSLGYDHLTALEAPFEVSMPLGYAARLTIVAKPVFLDSGQADGTAVTSVQESTTGGTTLVQVPQPIGTLTATDTTPPAQQNAAGVGGEVQLAFGQLALAAGYTPAGFLVATVTGRVQWKPGNGPFTFNFARDPVKDTQLSYAGLRDPAGNTLDSLGQIWGGVVADQGNVQFAHGDAMSGFYLGGGGQYLSGYKVQTNTRIDGNGGAYWRVWTSPEHGNLSIGANFFGMHYAHNQGAFTHGMGGYFSPQAYFLGNVPFTWTGHAETRWHYSILGSLGVQAFQEDKTPLWPLAVDKALETAMSNAMLPAKTLVGSNYDLRGQGAYQISPHWFAGGFLSANNSRNYTSMSAGFYVRYLFRSQPSTVTGPTGIFPTEGLRPFTVP